MAGILDQTRLESIERYIVRKHGEARQLTLRERNILDFWVSEIVTEIAAAWPVDTSASRDAWSYTIQGGRDFVGFTLENSRDYAEFIHFAGSDELLKDTLVPETVDRFIPDLIAELKAQIDATEREIVRINKRGGRGLLDILQVA